MQPNSSKTVPPLSFEFPPRVMMIEARFYEQIADYLAGGALRVLENYGAKVERFNVPGALEIPAAVEMGVQSRRFDAYVALGCVIRGETSHYDIVAGESARALMDLSVRHTLCLGNGIITVENEAQAIARAKPDDMDKGGGAALAALRMLALKNTLGGRR